MTVFYFLAALVNKGNCHFASGDLDKARDHYQEALNAEASCTDALFNLGKDVAFVCLPFCSLLLPQV